MDRMNKTLEDTKVMEGWAVFLFLSWKKKATEKLYKKIITSTSNSKYEAH